MRMRAAHHQTAAWQARDRLHPTADILHQVSGDAQEIARYQSQPL